MRAIGRWVGYLLVALAAIAAVYDGIAAVRTGTFRAATLGEWWNGIAPHSLDSVLGLSPWLTEHFIASMIAAPAWAVLGVPGVLLAFAYRRRNGRRRRGRTHGL